MFLPNSYCHWVYGIPNENTNKTLFKRINCRNQEMQVLIKRRRNRNTWYKIGYKSLKLTFTQYLLLNPYLQFHPWKINSMTTWPNECWQRKAIAFYKFTKYSLPKILVSRPLDDLCICIWISAKCTTNILTFAKAFSALYSHCECYTCKYCANCKTFEGSTLFGE